MGEASATARTASAPETGEVIDGKFRIERRVGEGGMGLVLEATHLKLDQRVALKFLKPDALDRPDIVARFAQEARAAVKLKSEHIARVLDVGEHRGLPFMVMEFLEGKDLEELLASNGPMPVAEAVELLIQACEGINEAHAKGIVHRDVKPANLFVAQSEHGGTIKVLDFGISKAALTGKISDVDLGSSKTTSIMGSPYYMSPEQLRSTKDVDHRTDIWALGVVLFEILTGRTAFEESVDFPQLVARILESEPRRLSDFMSHPPAGLQAVLDRAMTKDRAARYRSAAELAIALVPFARTRGAAVIASRAAKVTRAAGIDPNLRVPWSSPPGPMPESAALARTDLTLSPETLRDSRSSSSANVTQTTPPETRRTPLLIGAAIVIIAAIVAVGIFVRGGPTTTASAPVPTPTAAIVAPVETSRPMASAVPVAPEPAAAAPSSTPAETSSASSSGHRPVPNVGGLQRVPKKPSTHPASSAPSGDLDIRRER
jgi:serine/threonine-protein kinase